MKNRPKVTIEGRVASGQIVRVPADYDLDDGSLSALVDEIAAHWAEQDCDPPVVLVGDEIEVLEDRAVLLDIARRCLRRWETLRPADQIPTTPERGE